MEERLIIKRILNFIEGSVEENDFIPVLYDNCFLDRQDIINYGFEKQLLDYEEKKEADEKMAQYEYEGKL